MTENENDQPVGEAAPEEEVSGPEGPPALSPAYQPATEDSVIIVRFVGNTAQIGDLQTRGIDAFQMLALGSFLEMKGKQTIAMIEAEAMRQEAVRRQQDGILTAGKIPTPEELANMPPGMRPPGA